MVKSTPPWSQATGVYHLKPHTIGIKMRITDVASAWVKGQKARTRSLVTKDGKVWSYNLLIAKTADDGTLVIYDYTNSAGNYISQSTTYHVSSIIRAAYFEAASGQKVVITRKVPYRRNRNIDRETVVQ